MKVELRNLKYAQFASEETNCFEATLVIDGKPRGMVRNEGHGGSHIYDDWNACKELDVHAKTLPVIRSEHLIDGKPFEYPQDADSLVDDAFMVALAEKDLKRLLKTKVLMVKDGKLLGTKKVPAAQMPRAIQQFVAKGDSVVLNAIPFEQALELYRKHG